MFLHSPNQIAVFTESGRRDSAAEVSFVGGRVLVSSEEPLCWVLLRWSVPLAEGVQVLGDAWERGYGDLEWRGISAERVLPWYMLLHDPKNSTTQGFGVQTGAASFASWRVDASGITLVLDIRNGGAGVRLRGRTLEAAQVVTLESKHEESTFVFATRFCRALCPAPRLPAQPVYGGNDWYFRYGNISHETVQSDAARVRSLAPSRENAPFFVIDAGWFPASGCDGGPYTHGNEKFPDLPGLAEWMTSEEVRPGIWIRPLLNSAPPESWHLQNPLRGAEGGRGVLDPTVPEVLDLVHTDIARLAGWGYQLIKHDFTTFDVTGRWGFSMGSSVTPDGWHFADRTKTTAEVLTGLYRTIRAAAGEAYLIGCNTVGHLGAGLFELQRTGDDTSGKHWERTRKMGVNTLAFRMPQHNTFFAVDADCVGLTRPIPWELNRSWLELLSKSGTPLFVSADPDALGPEQRRALTEAFDLAATVQQAAEPLDWLSNTCPARWSCGTYAWDEFLGSAFPCPG
jgi:alpha-galactosidase